MPLVAKATTITLTGLTRDEVAALITRTAGREPDADLVDGCTGVPAAIRSSSSRPPGCGARTAAAGMIATGVRETVRRRLAQLPAAVVEALTVAAVLGREFHRQVLAASSATPAAQVDRLLDRAVTARLVVARGGGRFAFAHDLVRETLYDGLHRRGSAGPALRGGPGDRHLPTEVTDRLIPADVARHAYLAGPALDRGRVTELLIAAARHAFFRLAIDEAAVHFGRALEVVEDPAQRVRLLVEFGGMRYHHAGREESVRTARRGRDAGPYARRPGVAGPRRAHRAPLPPGGYRPLDRRVRAGARGVPSADRRAGRRGAGSARWSPT